MHNWLSVQAPGTLVSKLLSPIEEDYKGENGLQKKSILMSLAQMRRHIDCIRGEKFNHKAHNKKGYAISGAIRTNGFRLQLQAYKLK
jgi:hypothetical protein